MKKLFIPLIILFACRESPQEVKIIETVDSMPKLLIYLDTPCQVYLDINGRQDSLNYLRNYIYGIADTFDLLVGKNKIIFDDKDPIYLKPLVWEFEADYWQEKIYIHSCY